MITSRKTSLTDDALEGLGASVFAIMSRQFIGASKSPFAFGPLAGVGLFTRVYPLMRLQMRALRIHLGTPHKITVMDATLFQLRIIPPIVANSANTHQTRNVSWCSWLVV